LASSLIGFTGTDGHGLLGLEYSLDSRLSGTVGRKVTIKDAASSEIPNADESYIAPQNGNDVSLTLDVNIQTIAEKYLSQAVTDNNADRW
jgi:stage V sporulation protein D (sporulation-specific penicillin-binding protein)